MKLLLSLKSLMPAVLLILFFASGVITNFAYASEKETSRPLVQSMKNNENTVFGEELVRLKLTVSRGANPNKKVSFNQVPNLQRNDNLHIGIVDEDFDDGESFSTKGYKYLVVIFVPVSRTNQWFNNRDFKIEVKNLTKVTGARNCFDECNFKAPAEYTSFPVVFLVTDNSNTAQQFGAWLNSNTQRKSDLRRFVSSDEAHERLKNFGKDSFNFIVEPRKIQFLLDIAHTLKEPAAANPKVFQSLCERASVYFAVGSTDNCRRKAGETAQNFHNRNVKFLTDFLAKQKGSLEEIQNLANKLNNWQAIARELGAETVAQLKGRIPNIDVYFAAASLIIQLVEPLFRQRTLLISSALAAEIENRAGIFSVHGLLSKTTGEGEATAAKTPKGKIDRAVFFVPFEVRPDSTIPNENDFAAVTAKPMQQCLLAGNNAFVLPKNIVKEQAVKNFKLNFSNAPVNPINLSVRLSEDALEGDFDEELLQQLGSLPKVKGRISFDYAFLENPVTNEFEIAVSQPQNWEIAGQAANFFRKSRTLSLPLTAQNTGCFEKVVYVDKFGSKRIELKRGDETNGTLKIESNSEVSVNFNLEKFKAIQSGDGELEIYQYGFADPVAKLPVKLHPEIPQVTNVTVYRGDAKGEVKFTEAQQEQIKDIKAVKINGIEMMFSFDEKFNESWFNFPSGESASGETVQLSLVMKNGEEVPHNKTYAVKPPRQKFVSAFCFENPLNSFVGGRWNNSSSQYQNFDITPDNCSVIPADQSNIIVTLETPSGSNYSFIQNGSYKVKVMAENYEIETDADPQCRQQPKTKSDTNSAVILGSPLESEINLQINLDKFRQFLPCSGWRLRFALVDRNGNESAWHTITQTFVNLPLNPALDCSNGTGSCLLKAENHLGRVKAVSINGDKESEYKRLVTSATVFSMPMNKSSVWIKLQNGKTVRLKESAVILPNVPQ